MFQVIRQISCGAAHVVALSDDGLLQAWGKVFMWNIFCYIFVGVFCSYIYVLICLVQEILSSTYA